MVNKHVKIFTLENGIKVYVPCRGQKTIFPTEVKEDFLILWLEFIKIS